MKLAAYQFSVSGNIKKNTEIIKEAIKNAAAKKVDLIAFPECALSGYPPRDVASSKDTDYVLLKESLNEIKLLSDELGICVIVGSMALNNKYFNRAYVFAPGKNFEPYDKRALYGWDNENFERGNTKGIYEIDGIKIGVRICFEARFPEYFRELYKENTDLDIVIFYAASDDDDFEKYEVIKSNLVTRAVENVTPIFSVDATGPFQTAPTCFINASGRIMIEAKRNEEEMIIYDFEKKELNFGELGRKRESDILLGM